MTKKYKWLGALGGSGLVFVLLVGMFYWVLVSGKANGWIRDYLVDELSSQLALPCHIGHIEGNPFGGYQVLDVRVGDLFLADTIEVHYKPVFAYRVVIDSLKIKGLQVNISEIKNAESPKDFNALKTWVPFEIANIDIARGTVVLADKTEISNLFFRGGFSARDDVFKLIVSRYQSHQFDPPWVISNLSGIGVMDGGQIALQDVALSLPHSQIYLSGKVGNLNRPLFDFSFRGNPLSLQDFRTWLPDQSPDLLFDAEGVLRGGLQSASAEMTVQWDATTTNISVNGSLVPLDIRVDAHALMHPFTLQKILKSETNVLAEGKVDAVVYLDSMGVNTVSTEAHITRLVVGEVVQKETLVKVSYDAGDVSGEITTVGTLGHLDLRGNYHLGHKKGQAQIEFQELDVSLLPEAPRELKKLTGQVSIVSDSLWTGQLHLTKAFYDSNEFKNL